MWVFFLSDKYTVSQRDWTRRAMVFGVGGVGNKTDNGKAKADRYGINKQSNGNDKSKSWRVEFLHSHPCRDKTATWMGHAFVLGWVRENGSWQKKERRPGASALLVG
jgi:hypothetical protein